MEKLFNNESVLLHADLPSFYLAAKEITELPCHLVINEANQDAVEVTLNETLLASLPQLLEIKHSNSTAARWVYTE